MNAKLKSKDTSLLKLKGTALRKCQHPCASNTYVGRVHQPEYLASKFPKYVNFEFIVRRQVSQLPLLRIGLSHAKRDSRHARC